MSGRWLHHCASPVAVAAGRSRGRRPTLIASLLAVVLTGCGVGMDELPGKPPPSSTVTVTAQPGATSPQPATGPGSTNVPTSAPTSATTGPRTPTTTRPGQSSSPGGSLGPTSPTGPSGIPTGSVGRRVGCPAPQSAFLPGAPGSGRTVALTFDDGPGASDLEIAAVLRRYGVRATFFFTGSAAQVRPDVVRRIAADGHLVANHSYTHSYPAQVPGGWSVAWLVADLQRTNAVLKQVSGQPICFFRPPGGNTENVLAASRAVGLTATLWTHDTQDWRAPTQLSPSAVDDIVQAAIATDGHAHPIVLLHSTAGAGQPGAAGFRGNTIAALPRILEWYAAHGYRFVDLAGRSAR